MQNTCKLDLRPLDGTPFELFGLEFTPVRLCHGKGTVLGFRFGRAAYLTDHSEIPEESRALLYDLDVLFLDALRHRPHPTHTTLEQALKWVEEFKPRRAFFTHMCHDLSHERPRPHCRNTSGWLMTGWRSTWGPRAIGVQAA